MAKQLFVGRKFFEKIPVLLTYVEIDILEAYFRMRVAYGLRTPNEAFFIQIFIMITFSTLLVI